MRMLVIGAGAVSGYFGAKLVQAGRDVTFLLRPGRAEKVRKEGLRIAEPGADFTVRPEVLTADALRAAPQVFDVVLLGVKAYQLEQAMQDFAPAVGERTLILPLLNGMRHLELLAERFGRDKVLGGWSRISSDLEPDGTVRVFAGYSPNIIQFGEMQGGVTERTAAVHALLDGAGFPAELVPNIMAGMWNKWFLLASLAATTCLLRGPVGEIAAVRWGAETARGIVAECAAVVAAEGYPQETKAIEEHYVRMTKPGSGLTASMFRDVIKGAPVEAEHTLGDLLARAEAKKVQAPLTKAAYVQLMVFDRSRR